MSDEKEALAAGESDNEPFLRRWSRRKADVRSGVEVEQNPSSAGAEAAGPPGRPGAEAGQAVELPDLDTLGEDSDYSAFMSPGVDADLRRKALRKLFSSPKFNVIDDMDDYCGDFTRFEGLGGIVTADMKHHVERLARAAEKALDDAGQPETAAVAAAPAATPVEDAASDAPAGQVEPEKEDHDGSERPA